MDAFNIAKTVLLISWCIAVTGQDTSTGIEVTTENTTLEYTTTSLDKSCFTTRELAGVCIARQNCDYGTPGIDRTLYAHRGYIKSCATDEVCCPHKYIAAAHSSSTDKSQDDNLDLDTDI